MKVQIIAKIEEKFNKKTQEVETIERKIDNVEYVEFDPIKDDYCISSDKGLRYLFLNKARYRLSLASYKECRKRNLVRGI